MKPYAMTLLIVAAVGCFAWQIHRRWRLMRIGPDESRLDHIGERLRRTWKFAFAQKRMTRYLWAGVAHRLIFTGFLVLLLRSLMLFGRGYSPDFDFWGLFARGTLVGDGYSFLKDLFAVLVIIATLVFVYYRVLRKLPRMSLSFEGLLILIMIEAMMWGDILHDGAEIVARARVGAESITFAWSAPAGSLMAIALRDAGGGGLAFMSQLGYWTHVSLVLLFLNLLPASKHFHVITAIPNVFTQSLAPRGRLPNVDDIEGRIEREETLGLARIDQLTWKGVLDLYTCTECGRCTDHCPAANTGKRLSPKQLTLDLRDHLYRDERRLTGGDTEAGALVPEVISPEVLWACTTCGACETECPVFISYVDKIVDMRRNLVMERSEFPGELQNAFRGLETNANPWGFPSAERAAWAEGLDVPLLSDNPDAEILFWVGCSASFDDRARRIARATAALLKTAGVNFAILGPEEQCTGDPARRAGNEYLFQILAQANVETLNGHKVKKIVTACPHCFNTLLNEYPDFGGRFEVIHHTDYLARLLRDGRLKPIRRLDARVVYHDSCYLGRYNEVYDAPRETLRAIPGLTVLEPAETRDRGMCCGAGGAQMFKEEETGTGRVNAKRTGQLLATKPDKVASACPFCQRMLLDGLADADREDIGQFDVAELLWESIEPASADPKPAAEAGKAS